MNEHDTETRNTEQGLPCIKMPDAIWAWTFAAKKQDDVMQGGWTQYADWEEQQYVKLTPERDAAPDMLEALRAWDQYDNLVKEAGHTLIVGHLKGAYSRATEATRAAIAKAEGKA